MTLVCGQEQPKRGSEKDVAAGDTDLSDRPVPLDSTDRTTPRSEEHRRLAVAPRRNLPAIPKRPPLGQRVRDAAASGDCIVLDDPSHDVTTSRRGPENTGSAVSGRPSETVAHDEGETVRRVLQQSRNEFTNRWCADCRSRLSEFVSGVVGVFVCGYCADVHRTLRLGEAGLQWRSQDEVPVGTRAGNVSAEFRHALTHCASFTREELHGFGLERLSFDCHVKIGGTYYVPEPVSPLVVNIDHGSFTTWSVEMASWVASRGNRMSNLYYLAHLSKVGETALPSKDTTPGGRALFIKSKYEDELWVRNPPTAPVTGRWENLRCLVLAQAARVSFMLDVRRDIRARIGSIQRALKLYRRDPSSRQRLEALKTRAFNVLKFVSAETNKISEHGRSVVHQMVNDMGGCTRALRPLVFGDAKSTFPTGRLKRGAGIAMARGEKPVELTQAKRRARLLRVRRNPCRPVWWYRYRRRVSTVKGQLGDWFRPTSAQTVVHFECPEIGAILCIVRDGRRFKTMRDVLKR